MSLNRFGHAAASWARCSMVMAMAVGCGSGSSLPSQSTDERLMAQEASLREEDDPNPFVFTFDSYPYGISMKEWAFNWMRWVYSIPAATNPTIVGADDDQNHFGPVYFVPEGPNHHDTFAVARHKAVAVMLSQINNDYLCRNPAFPPAPGQSLFDFLPAGFTELNDNITVVDVTGEDT
jgi:hypothetical protein